MRYKCVDGIVEVQADGNVIVRARDKFSTNFTEDDGYRAQWTTLNLSGYGKTPKEAIESMQWVVGGYLEFLGAESVLCGDVWTKVED